MQINLAENVHLIFWSYLELGTNIKLELFCSNNIRGEGETRSHAEYFWLVCYLITMGQILYPPKYLYAY